MLGNAPFCRPSVVASEPGKNLQRCVWVSMRYPFHLLNDWTRMMAVLAVLALTG